VTIVKKIVKQQYLLHMSS